MNKVKNDLLSGFIDCMPAAISVFAYGGVLGVIALQKGIGWFPLLLMDLSIFAGTAQFLMLDMWTTPLPVFEIVLAVIIINLRYFLIGASLNSLFEKTSFHQKLLRMHFVTDENWAVTMAAKKEGKANTSYLLGGGLAVLLLWCLGTMLGYSLGSFISNPEVLALDFVIVAVFTSLTVTLYRGKKDILPWILAAGIAVLTYHFVPGKWYIITGGLAGAITSTLMRNDEKPKLILAQKE